MDFSNVLLGLSIVAAVTAIIGAGALAAMPGFGRWAVDRVARFFDNADEDEADQIADEEFGESDDEAPCEFAGHEFGGEDVCIYCGIELDEEDDLRQEERS
jgi:hypothetical protein